MTYQLLREFADSWGLALMTLLFLTLAGWPFLPRARAAGRRAAHSIFDERD